MATRVVVGGVAPIPGETMLERKDYFERNLDDLRLWLMREPRGHGAMSGAILQPPTRPDADWGVLFIEVSGCLPMCGHGTIGVATVLLETGMIPAREPETVIRFDTPAGLVGARVQVESGSVSSVTLQNVPAFCAQLDSTIEVPRYGAVTYGLAYGGNFYAFVRATDTEGSISLEHTDELIERGLALMDAINVHSIPVHPLDERIRGCRHVVFHESGQDGADTRSATVIHPGWVDRSPCGTGTSALMALLHAQGTLRMGEVFVNESPLGTRFQGRLISEEIVGPVTAVVPEITGRAWITGMATYMLSAGDPFPVGFRI
jgi:proline racemase